MTSYWDGRYGRLPVDVYALPGLSVFWGRCHDTQIGTLPVLIENKLGAANSQTNESFLHSWQTQNDPRDMVLETKKIVSLEKATKALA